ncbi:hypothetical protein DICPUDRAFT_79830 [Dictyostelium purpureum]|uniref:Amidinotransferase n=1 Tax=Dictyostelium purpureum TaxID=5786 RepID=F0ZNR4_DICPU|nr:uncharacterized protein DICPUDRAFT_79830 [Dictyostelium purpureum]EGC34431.1 hypothetical protein DICPUDRAFT_79830 [Dictyostelium purpureum]|eukprot:XP_003289060.1 hypothetical protein DICPUDRAFT_79830 [Dictyostelium purpureum]
MTRNQSSNNILMVEPTHFESNVQAIADNTFMNKPGEGLDIPTLGVKEFTEYCNAIKEKNVNVKLFQPKGDGIETPDCVFPNNWFSTHSAEEMSNAGGKNTLVLYPMCHPNRRLERRANIIEFLKNRYPADQLQIVDFTHYEEKGMFLEGTGSFVLDRVNKNAYICISQRSHKQLAQEWCDKMGYNLVAFESLDSNNKIVYHTNVIMAICTKIAVICLDSIATQEDREMVEKTLSKTHTIVNITKDQVNQFCGNVIEVQNGNGDKFFVCSESSFKAFTEQQKETIKNNCNGGFITRDIPTIQSVGGGGIRCMIAELF